MLPLLVKRHSACLRLPVPHLRRTYSTKVSKPLRILFCGSDDFSSTSLRALHKEQEQNSQTVASIDVLCRPGKRVGRGLQTVREVPIKKTAQELGLRIHEQDTFKGWEPPMPDGQPINLIIAVSFGLFVPPRILKAAEYGGLNLHPSLLPAFRGPAPIYRTLLNDVRETGVTLQTLDEKAFDRGVILASTGKILIDGNLTHEELLNILSPKAASLLVQGIREKMHVPPLRAIQISHMPPGVAEMTAPKITSVDRHIDWEAPTHKLVRYNHILGPLWTEAEYPAGVYKRWLLGGLEAVSSADVESSVINIMQEGAKDAMQDTLFVARFGRSECVVRGYSLDGTGAVVFHMSGREGLKVKSILVEGQRRRPAADVLAQLRKAWVSVQR